MAVWEEGSSWQQAPRTETRVQAGKLAARTETWAQVGEIVEARKPVAEGAELPMVRAGETPVQAQK